MTEEPAVIVLMFWNNDIARDLEGFGVEKDRHVNLKLVNSGGGIIKVSEMIFTRRVVPLSKFVLCSTCIV